MQPAAVTVRRGVGVDRGVGDGGGHAAEPDPAAVVGGGVLRDDDVGQGDLPALPADGTARGGFVTDHQDVVDGQRGVVDRPDRASTVIGSVVAEHHVVEVDVVARHVVLVHVEPTAVVGVIAVEGHVGEIRVDVGDDHPAAGANVQRRVAGEQGVVDPQGR